MKIVTFLFTLFIVQNSFAYRTDFTPDELAKLKKGEKVERVKELKDEVFPQVTIAQVIPHSPKQNMDVFTDFEHHKDFIPGLLRSKIVHKEGNITDVDFKLHMPAPVSDSEYVTRHTLTNEGNNYYLEWNLLKSKQVKATKGMLMFEEFGDKTLFTYVNHITPKSSFAWVVKSKVVPDIEKNVEVIIKHLDKTILKR